MRLAILAFVCCVFSPACLSQSASAITMIVDPVGLPRLSPGGFATIYGAFPNGRRADFNVSVGLSPAYISAVSIDVKLNRTISIAIQVPTELNPGATSVTVTYLSGPVVSPAFPVMIGPYFPALGLDPYSAFVHTSGVGVTPQIPASIGETITTFMSGLGTTNPSVPTGANVSAFTPTAMPVTVTVGGVSATVVFAGRYPATLPFTSLDDQVSFKVPDNAPSGPNDVLVTIGGVASNAQTLFIGTPPLPSPPVIGSVVNAANFSSQVSLSPGAFATIFASGLGKQDILSAYPGTQVNGISVLFNGRPAPIFNVVGSAGQMTVLVPSDILVTGGSGGVAVSVVNPNGPSKAIFLQTAAAGPAMFLVQDPSNSSRHNVAALLANTGWYVMPASQAVALGFTACTGLPATARCGQPVKRGDFVQLYVTGLGTATPDGDPNGIPLGTGQVAPVSGTPIYLTPSKPVVTVGGQAATVVFCGLAPGYAGLYQINLQIPANTTPGDNVAITLTMPGSTTDSAVLAVQ